MMIPLLSPAEVRKAEDAANAFGVTYETMMEAAGRGCADFLLHAFPSLPEALILAGKGKNGGDGFVIARLLSEAGKRVTLVRVFSCPSDPLSESRRALLPPEVRVIEGETAPEEALWAVKNARLIVDAVFGIGFAGDLPERIGALLAAANGAPAARVAVDLPSGFAFRAHHTLSMLCLKPEQIDPARRPCCGRLHVIPIGISLPGSGRLSLTETEALLLLPPRPANAHKGTFGNTLILAGARQYPGAPVLAATGCLHAGSGLTTLGVPDVILDSVTAKLSEPVFLPLKTANNGGVGASNNIPLRNRLNEFSAVVLGPGLGVGEPQFSFVKNTLSFTRVPLVLDADGINNLAGNIHLLKWQTDPSRPCERILTPHPGEMGRLLGISAAEVNENREELALSFAKEYGVTLLLKGPNTLVASPDGRLYVNPTGAPALARGGSGDLLSGVIGALLSQGTPAFEAAALGAFFHGLAGEKAQRRYGPYACTVARIADLLFQ